MENQLVSYVRQIVESYKRVFERKQVGIVYHFTNDRIYDILKNNTLEGSTTSEMNYKIVSTTRDANLKNVLKASWGYVRITLNGDKLSDNYKIVPFYDLINLDDPEVKKVNPYYSESEEAIITNKIKILSKYILRIDLLNGKELGFYINSILPFLDTTDNSKVFYLKGTKIPVVIVDKFVPYHRTKLPESIKYKYVVRKGKRIKKAYTERPGYKIGHKDGRPVEVKMTPKERLKRGRGAKKAAKKPTKSTEINKRKKSTKKHTW